MTAEIHPFDTWAAQASVEVGYPESSVRISKVRWAFEEWASHYEDQKAVQMFCTAIEICLRRDSRWRQQLKAREFFKKRADQIHNALNKCGSAEWVDDLVKRRKATIDAIQEGAPDLFDNLDKHIRAMKGDPDAIAFFEHMKRGAKMFGWDTWVLNAYAALLAREMVKP
jgi:hypothetical protein